MTILVVDLETGGLDPRDHPVLAIGAVDLKTNKKFYGECAVNGKVCTDEALKVNGVNLDEWKYKPSLSSTLTLFQKFVNDCEGKILAGHNPRFDYDFLRVAFDECNLRIPFSFRTVDMHTLAYVKFGQSMSSDQIYTKLGMEKEPKPHNALNGAVHEAQAFRMLLEMFD